ncbi:MAG: SRPBCC family protein [Myxococcota bacterium]
MKIRHEVVIARPCPEVFAFVTDLRNETRWQPQIESVTLCEPLRRGACFHERRVTLGRTFDWNFRITEFDPPRSISIETIEGTMPYRGTRSFHPVPGGTRVVESGELQLPIGLRWLGPVLARWSRRPLRQAYERLRVLMENS